MRIIVLSLNNEVGKYRRSKLNYNYEHFLGTSSLEDIPKEILNKISRNNSKDEFFRRKSCAFYSHYRILRKIVEEKIDDVIVCEDDAILKDIPKFVDKDEAILLNGELHHPKNFKLDKEFNRDEIEFVDGINEIDYSKYRWSCVGCVYYPTYKSAEKILKYLDNSKTQYTHMDLYMSKHKLIKYLQYPSVFKIVDEGTSQIGRARGTIDNFRII